MVLYGMVSSVGVDKWHNNFEGCIQLITETNGFLSDLTHKQTITKKHTSETV